MARMLARAHFGRTCHRGCCVEFRRDLSFRRIRKVRRAREKQGWRKDHEQEG